MNKGKAGDGLAHAGVSLFVVATVAFAVAEIIALFATWGTGHFWAALFIPPYGLWITIAWIFGLWPFS